MSPSDDPLAALDTLPTAARIRTRRLTGGVASIVADATGLDTTEATALEKQFHDAALALPGVTEARIAMTAAQPSRTVIAVGSGKGGVGKSTVSVNLAVALARKGHKVGLIDADVYGPSQPTLLGSAGKAKAKDERLIPTEAHGIRFLSVGQLVSPGHALAWRGPMATGALTKLLDADWGNCDVLVVDMPPGTGDVQITLVQKMRPNGAVIVSTPQDLSLIDATRAIDLFNKTHVPVLGIIENMASYVCPHCGEASDPFGSGGAEATAADAGVAFLGRLPLSLAIRKASDQGEPPAAGTGPDADAFASLADRIMAAVDTAHA
jgi:ATP-binding protein involved in chromosome partitioning